MRTVLMEMDDECLGFKITFRIPYSAISVSTYEHAKAWILGRTTDSVDDLLSVAGEVIKDELLYRHVPDYEIDDNA